MYAEREHWFIFFLVQQKMESSIFSLKFSMKEFHEGGEKNPSCIKTLEHVVYSGVCAQNLDLS